MTSVYHSFARAPYGEDQRAQLIRHPAGDLLGLLHCQYSLSPRQFWCHMSDSTSQPWYALYAATMVELDHKLLLKRMEATEAAIQARLHDLRHDSDHHAERQEIDDAIRNLTLLRRCYPYEDA